MSYRRQITVRVPIPALAVGVTANVSATWSPAFPDTNFSVEATVWDPAGLASLVGEATHTASGSTFPVKNVGVSALTGGTAYLELTATRD